MTPRTRALLLAAVGLAGLGWVMVAGVNVNVSGLNGEQEEVDIGLDPVNPSHLVAGSNDVTTGSPRARAYESLNGGGSWTNTLLTLASPYTYASDPAIAFDRSGNAYFAYVAFNNWYQLSLFVAKKPAGASAWNAPVLVPNDQADKELIAIDTSPTSPCVDNIYVAWDNNENTGQTLRVSRSINGGASFLAPPKVNDTGTTVIGASPAAGPDGTVYVAWANYAAHQLIFDKSTDCGATFGTDKVVHTWAANTGSDLSFFPAAAPKRGVGVFPYLAVDHSNGPRRGRVYLAYNDQGPAGAGVDIFVRYSDDQGGTWSNPIRVNDDSASANNDQILPRISVDASDGSVHVVFYDTRNDPNHKKTDVYYARSTDGQTFEANGKVTSAQSDQSGPAASGMGYGEYAGLAVGQGKVHVLWTDNRGGDDEVYTAPIFNELAIVTATLPAARVGVAYSSALVGSGGTPPYSWAVTGLPAALSFDPATGLVTGTASAADLGWYTLNVTLTDSTSTNISRTVNLEVTYPPLVIGTVSLATAQASVAYSMQLSGSGGVPPYLWSIANLPASMAIDPASGAISGTPLVFDSGTRQVVVTLADSVGGNTLKTFTLNVTALPLAISSSSLPIAEVGASYSAQLLSSGGIAPFLWRWTQGFVPPSGLGISTGGLISGTPAEGTAGDFLLKVSLRDGSVPAAQSVDAEVPLLVLPRLVAHAGDSRTVDPGTHLLDASKSSDPTGGELTYAWIAPTGVALSDPASAKPSVTLAKATDYGFMLTVKRPGATSGSSAQVVLTVRNLPPVLTIEPPANVEAGATVALEASASDPNGDVLRVSWGQVSGPPVSFETTSGVATSFVAAQPGDYVLQASASDGQLTATQEISLSVSGLVKKPGCGCGGGGVELGFAAVGVLALLRRRRAIWR